MKLSLNVCIRLFSLSLSSSLSYLESRVIHDGGAEYVLHWESQKSRRLPSSSRIEWVRGWFVWVGVWARLRPGMKTSRQSVRVVWIRGGLQVITSIWRSYTHLQCWRRFPRPLRHVCKTANLYQSFSCDDSLVEIWRSLFGRQNIK